MDKLLPDNCPCCASTAAFHEIEDQDNDDWGAMFIQCDNPQCGLSSRLQFGENKKTLLLEWWNRRANPMPGGEVDFGLCVQIVDQVFDCLVPHDGPFVSMERHGAAKKVEEILANRLKQGDTQGEK